MKHCRPKTILQAIYCADLSYCVKEELPFNGLAESLLKVLNDKLETLTTTEYFIKFSYLLAGKYERTTTRNFRSTDDKTAKEYVDNFSSVFSTAYEAEDKFTLLEWGKVS